MLRGEKQLAERSIEDTILWSLTEDSVGQAGQGVIPDRRAWRLGRSDVGIILLHEIWRRELGALSSGDAPKPWRRTAECVCIA